MAAENEIVFNVKVNADGAVVASSSVKAQLREANKEANEMAIAFGATSKQAVDAARKVALMKEELSDVKDTINALNPEAKLNAVTGAVQGIAGGFAAAEGAMALFGTQSEEVQQQMLKVQGALAMSQGINQILSLGDSFKNLKIVIAQSAVAQGLYNLVVGASTGLMKALRIAMAATGVGALVVGIGLLVANFDKLKKLVDDNIESIKSIAMFVYKFLTPIGLAHTAIEELGKRFTWVQTIIDATVGALTSVKDSIVELLVYVNLLDSEEENAAQAQAERSKAQLEYSDKNVKAKQREIELAKLQGATEDEIRAKQIVLLDEQLEAYLNYINAKKKAGEEVTKEEQEELDTRQYNYKVAILEDANLDKKEQEEKVKALQEKNKKLADERQKASDAKKAKELKEEQEATAALLKAEEERQALMKQYALDVSARRAELEAEERAKTFEGRKQQIQIDLQNELELLTGADAATSELKKQLQTKANAQTLAIDAEFLAAQKVIEDEKTALEKSEAEKRKALRDAVYSNTIGGLKTLGANIQGENKKSSAIAKTAALVDLGVQTGKGIANAIQIGTSFGASLGPAGVVAGPLAIASMVGLTLANFAFAAKKIGAPTPGGAPSAGSVSIPTAPVANVTSTQAVTDTGALRAQANQPIRAVVVETELTQTQKRVSSIEERATF